MIGLVDQVLSLLPAGGGPVLYEELLRLARERNIHPSDVGKALSVACSAGRAVSQDAQGFTFVRRRAPEQPPIILPRPRRQPPRARR